MALVECVPNFSEGRRAEVIAALVEAVQSVPVALLDVSSDADHNRTRDYLRGRAGSGEPRRCFAPRESRLSASIWTSISGVHPRMGAVDVIPFVPLRDISLDECAALARAFGQRVGDELGIPVYLYEAAALRPERVNLADVRRGGYEFLKTAIQTPERAPDFGPARHRRGGRGRRWRARPVDRLQRLSGYATT